MSSIYKNQIGAELYFVLNVDLTEITLVEIEITKPDATVWTLSTASTLIISEAPTGTLLYTTTAITDLDQLGTYFCNFFITDAGTRLYSGNTTLSIYDLGSPIIIHEQYFNLIKAVIGYPDVDSLLLTDDQIKSFALFPSMQKYFNKFPIKVEQSQSIIGETLINFPDDYTFGVLDARTVDVGLIGGVGGSFWDVVAFQSYNNSYIASKTAGAYGKKGYNPSGLVYQRDVQRQTLKSQQNMYTTLKTRVDYTNKRLIAYSSITGTLNITWAKYSNNFDDVQYEYKMDVIKLAQAEVMLHLANSAAMLVDSSLEVTINVEHLKQSATDIFAEITEKWAAIPDIILLHQC